MADIEHAIQFESFSDRIYIFTIKQILTNIKPLNNDLSSQPCLQNILDLALTAGINLQLSSQINNVNVSKIDRERYLLQTENLLQHTFKRTIKRESVCYSRRIILDHTVDYQSLTYSKWHRDKTRIAILNTSKSTQELYKKYKEYRTVPCPL
jgi:hypothetical protein